MSWLLPFPFASAGLLVIWLLFNQSLSPGQLLLGIAVAIAGGWALAALQPPKTRVRRVMATFELAALVTADIIRSNIIVARIILGQKRKQNTSGLVNIPLELRDPYGLAALACIITSTPGTLWVDFNAASGELTIHVLDLIDSSEWVHIVKGRYERKLLEIFA